GCSVRVNPNSVGFPGLNMTFSANASGQIKVSRMRCFVFFLLVILIDSCVAHRCKRDGTGRCVDLTCPTLERCTKAGNKIGVVADCQNVQDDCEGTMLEERKYCGSKYCGCCVPPLDCGEPNLPCKKKGERAGVTSYCLPKADKDTCTGRFYGGKKMCDISKKCGCCVPSV
ncbi:unnamed protein product, partial [Meganyctiphanes norvegica]